MTKDISFWVELGKLFQEGTHGRFLCFGTGISKASMFINTSFIDDTQRAVIIMTGMDALHILRQERLDAAIKADIVMVADLTKAGTTCGNKLLGAEWLIALSGGAVANDEFY